MLDRLPLRTQRAIYGYIFVLPWLIGFLILLAYPLLFSFWLSFREIKDISTLATVDVGLDNYRQAFLVDVNFLPAFVQTLSDLLIDLPIINLFALGVALLVVRPLPGRTFFRVVLFMPVVIGSAWVIQQLLTQGVGQMAIVGDPREIQTILKATVGTGSATPLLDL